ncbi:MAG: hypothetical protein LBS54_07270, partial [Dysgonamonadaceae bacterium]|nr:hypothetical protein [Dysgonamonadaceae bacterium]
MKGTGLLLLLLLLLFVFAVVEAVGQPEMTFTLNKEGKIIVMPRRKTYELTVPAYSYASYTPASTMLTDMKLREFVPETPPGAPDELPMNMQVLSDAYRPFFNVYMPMLRRVSPFASDFSELSVVPLNDHLAFLTGGVQATWPGLGGMTRVSSALVWSQGRWTLSGGGFAGRFYTPFNLSPEFMGGANLQLRYEAGERLAFRAWGQYAAYSGDKAQTPFLLMNPSMNQTGAGGAVEFMFTKNLGIGTGV